MLWNRLAITFRPRPRRQAETLEDRPDPIRWMDGGENPAKTARALENINGPHSVH